MSAQHPPSAQRRGIASRASSVAARAGAVSRKAAELAADRLAAPQVSRSLAPRPGDRFTVVVHFAGDAASAYQLEQWLWPLEQLAQQTSVGILCRGARTAARIAGLTDLPVRYGRSIADLDAVLGADAVRCVLYVNQSPLNFHALRHPLPAHVHLSHGESEKASMVTNQLKAYDRVLTAGQAARERITAQLIEFGEGRMLDVGRPQLDRPRTPPEEWTDWLRAAGPAAEAGSAAPGGHRTGVRAPVVLWAPTWEGDSPSMAYGTLPTSGEALVEALSGEGARILYRPHPRTGYADARFRAADQRVRERVRAAGGFVDETDTVSWQFDEADACIAEMSSVAFDWLATRKPLALLLPSDPRAETVHGGLFERVPSYQATAAGQAGRMLVAAVAPEGGQHGRDMLGAAAQHYLGDVGEGAQIGRFRAAVAAIVREREAALSARG